MYKLQEEIIAKAQQTIIEALKHGDTMDVEMWTQLIEVQILSIFLSHGITSSPKIFRNEEPTTSIH